jgi:flagellar biosynthetic protein FliR
VHVPRLSQSRPGSRAMTIGPELATAFILVFARVGTLTMLMPGIGETMIVARARLALAVLLTLVLFPVVRPSLPALPGGLIAPATIGVLIGEIFIGFTIGLAARIIIAALQTAGAIVAQELGLAYAQTVNPAFGGTDASIGNFLTITGLALVFATDLHHLAIAAIAASYMVIPAGAIPSVSDAAMLATRAAVQSFSVAVRIAAPFIVFGFLFNIGLGLLARLMPQLQVFFLALPATILGGMLVLLATIGVMMAVFLAEVRAFLANLLTG